MESTKKLAKKTHRDRDSMIENRRKINSASKLEKLQKEESASEHRTRSAQKNIDLPPSVKTDIFKIHSLDQQSPRESERKTKVEKKLFKMFTIDDNDIKESDSKISKVPLIHTKFKQLAKADTPHEIRMSQSQRLSELDSINKASDLQ